MKDILVRFNSSLGQERIIFSNWQNVIQKLQQLFNREFTISHSPSEPPIPTNSLFSTTPTHGQLFYIQFTKQNTLNTPQHSPSHPIDDLLLKQSGYIKRSKNPLLCKHNQNSMCEHCLPIPPWDQSYLQSNKIKFTSFHSYLKFIIDSNKTPPIHSPQFIPPLDQPSYSVLKNCPSPHEPYPRGICSKCQPSAISLQSQTFRMLDHVEFQSVSLMENFINAWRTSGIQRFGYLYGKYEPYLDVPLGIKAVVYAIYEPMQQGFIDGIQVDLSFDTTDIDQMAKDLDLEKVGMIYTDLTDDGSGSGKVVCKRHADSFFLSSAECISSASMQSFHPVQTKYSATGKFGSRFVTVVLSGNETNGIESSCFQISNVGVAMAKDGIIEASVDPSLMRVRESSSSHYIPEVFYKYKNSYGIMVQEAAKPTFPVDYLIVTMTHGFPQTNNSMFENTFPIENRHLSENINISHVQKQLKSQKSDLLSAISDFHFLVYLKSSHLIEKGDFELILQIVKTKSMELLSELVTRPSFENFLAIVNASSSEGDVAQSSSNGQSKVKEPWSCRHCTFVNMGNDCEMCGLPKD